MKSYNELLNTPQWKKKRQKILERDGHKCQSCGVTMSLQIHHRQYHTDKITGHKFEPWIYNDEYLVTLCDNCHLNGHKKYQIPIFKITRNKTMNLFSKMLQRNLQQPEPLIQLPEKSLFVDEIIPSIEREGKSKSAIDRFLNEDHFTVGLRAGYQLHCHDGVQLYQKQLRAKFREAIDILIGSLDKELLEKEIVRIQIGDMVPSQKHCLEASLNQTREMIAEAKLQKELSIDDEGWINNAASAFNLGFQKGMMDYFNEKEFLKGL